jgi:hypothetical protein
MVENWVDAVTKVFEINDGKGGLVLAYRLFEKANIPEAMVQFPCALSFIDGIRPVYSDGLSLIFWSGVTEMHLTPNVDKSNLPYILPFFGRIVKAAAGAYQLGGIVGVEHFIIPEEDNALQLVVLQYGDEAPHYAIRVRWEVKENVSGSVTVAI